MCAWPATPTPTARPWWSRATTTPSSWNRITSTSTGLTFRHYGLGDYAKAIYFNDASNNLVQGCTFAINDLGIGLKYDSGRNVIEENTFSDTDFNWPWDAVKAGSDLETGGIRFYRP